MNNNKYLYLGLTLVSALFCTDPKDQIKAVFAPFEAKMVKAEEMLETYLNVFRTIPRDQVSKQVDKFASDWSAIDNDLRQSLPSIIAVRELVDGIKTENRIRGESDWASKHLALSRYSKDLYKEMYGKISELDKKCLEQIKQCLQRAT